MTRKQYEKIRREHKGFSLERYRHLDWPARHEIRKWEPLAFVAHLTANKLIGVETLIPS